MRRRALTFASRLAFTSFLVTALGMLLLAGVLLLLVGRYEATRRAGELRASVQVEAAYLSELASLSNLRTASASFVERFGSSEPAERIVRIFGLRGELLASSSLSAGYFPSRAVADVVNSALPPLVEAPDRRYIAQPIVVDGQVAGVIEVSQSLEEERQLISLIGNVLFQATVVVLFVAIVGSVLVGQLMARQLERLRQVAEGVAGGDLGLRARPAGGPELAQLAQSLNRMADQLQERLAQAQASAERERRLYHELAHELRTPLTALHGYLEQIEDSATNEQYTAIEAMQREVRRLGRLASELSQMIAGARSLSPSTPVDLVSLIEDLSRALAGRALRTGVTLRSVVEGSPPLALGNADRLKQAILNLLDNALRHTPPGGTVTVTVRPTNHKEQDAVEVLVSDTGAGVDAALRERIWERGVSGPGGGSGIGLAIVRQIARAYGGEVQLLDQRPGASFRLILPAFTSVHTMVILQQ